MRDRKSRWEEHLDDIFGNARVSGSLVLSWSFETDSNGVLLVGVKRPGQSTEIMNAFTGDRAKEIVESLSGRHIWKK